jgi:hypothetical protein
LSVFDIVTAIAREMLDTFFLNYLFILLCVVIIMAVRAQHERYTELRGEIGGLPSRSLREITEEIILSGLITGFIGSFAVIAAGISIGQDAVRYLFYIMCLLLLINLRFLCISIAAGILLAVSLIFGYPKLDAPSILGLVAILHFIEAALIYLNKRKDSIPVYIKYREDIAGAYLTRKFWLVPIVFMTFLSQNAISTLSNSTADWWMLFRPEALKTGAYALGLDCLVAALGYSDLAITKHPEKKSRETAELIFCYSAILIVLAIASISIHWLVYAGVVFCVAAHEGIYLYGRHMEKNGSPLYAPVKRGLKVLEVLPGSYAEKMGIYRGDIILNINGRDIQSDEGVNAALTEYPTFIWVALKTWDGTEKTCEYWCYPDGCERLGIISVPREKDVTYNTDSYEHMSIIKNIVTRFRGINRSV